MANPFGFRTFWGEFRTDGTSCRPYFWFRNPFRKLAEREGFEPSVPFLIHRLSRSAHSTALAPLQVFFNLTHYYPIFHCSTVLRSCFFATMQFYFYDCHYFVFITSNQNVTLIQPRSLARSIHHTEHSFVTQKTPPQNQFDLDKGRG